MIISHKHKFIFVKNWKTASTSIEAYLLPHCGDKDIISTSPVVIKGNGERNSRGFFNPMSEIMSCNRFNVGKDFFGITSVRRTMEDLIKMNKFYPHMPAYQIKARIPKKIWDTYYKFCFERNVWDKIISNYFMIKGDHVSTYMPNISFEKYMEDKVFLSCLNYPRYMDGKRQEEVIVDHVGKYEDLNEEMEKICGKFNIPFTGDIGLRIYKNPAKSEEKAGYMRLLKEKYNTLVMKYFGKELKLWERLGGK